MATVEVTNIGPITKASIPAPDDGGVVVIRGRNGAGKSQALAAIDAATSGRGKLSVRQGELHGEVDAFGVRLKLGRSTRRTGEAEVVTLESRLNVADLVDPAIADGAAADARRIKALVQLSGVEARADLFYDLVGGQETFERLVSADTAAADDVLVMAGRVKRDLEAKARDAESKAEHEERHAAAAEESTADIDLTAEADEAALQRGYESAVQRKATLESQQQSADAAFDAAQAARAKLEAFEAEQAGKPSIAELSAALETAVAEDNAALERLEDAGAALEAAKRALAEAEAERKRTDAAWRAADQRVIDAKAASQAVEGWRETIGRAETVKPPSADELAEARGAVDEARKAIEAGALVRRAREQAAKATDHRKAATDARRVAERLRDAARGTDDVLSGLVAKSGSALRVEAGRLVTTTGRGTTYFAELSEGERWRMALDIAIEAVGPRGLLVIPQTAWEGLDPINRQAIAEHVRGTGVTVYTAEASADEELSAEVFV